MTDAVGASRFLPLGYLGIWAAIPYGMWFFLAIEGVPLAAEETQNPQRDLPRGLIGGIAVLLLFAALILIFGPGGSGSKAIMEADNPLVVALESPAAYGGTNWVSQLVNLVGLAGLVASFFSIIYAYSRLIFALSRAGYLPRFLSLTNRRNSPYLALLIPAVIGFLLSLSGKGELLILVAVFGATVSYVLMMASHIALRIKEPSLERPYRTPGGVITSAVALVLASAAVVAGFFVDLKSVLWAAAVFVAFVLYFALYSRHHLVAEAPGEGD